MEVRQPVVAGRFYPADTSQLAQDVRHYITRGRTKLSSAMHVIAGMAPHAGYMFSGPTAGVFYAAIGEVPSTVIILGPNHTGIGAQVAVDPHDAWLTPLGQVTVARDLAQRLARTGAAEIDAAAHMFEHSLEVHVPFLQVLRPDVRILPVCIGTSSYERAEALAQALADVTSAAGDDVLVVASTDMSHYVSASEARRLDTLAFDEISALDARALHDVVLSHDISMCGFMPVAVAMLWAKSQGATRGKILDYTNSGDVLGEWDEVVAYAAGVFIND